MPNEKCTIEFKIITLPPHDCRQELQNALDGWTANPVLLERYDYEDGVFMWTCPCGKEIPVYVEIVVEGDDDAD